MTQENSAYQAGIITKVGVHFKPTAPDLPLPIDELHLFLSSTCMPDYVSRLDKFLKKPVHVRELLLSDVLIEVPCKEGDIVHPSIEAFLISWLQGTKNKHLISITGDYGQGKTTALISASYKLLIDRGPVAPLPLYLRFSGQDVIGRSTSSLLAIG